MSALRLMGKWSVPVATAVAVPLFGPAVFADSGSKDAAKTTTTPTSRMIRPSELPIYEEPEEVLDFQYHGRERTSLEETVGSVRNEIEGILEATRSTRERVVHICETGKAHTMATIDYISDEENMLPRVGAITIGGLAGLVLGARKKGGLAKKAMYTSVGVTAAASLCYPRQAYQISQQAYGTAKEYANIGYNFVAGVKPQSKVAVPEEPKKEPPAEPIPEAESSTSPETPPAETAPAESEGGEVRSVLPHAIPDEKFPGSVDSLAQQTSDVMQWGFRLSDKDGSAPSVPPADVVPPAKSSVPEGFGTVGEAESQGIVEGAAEQVTVPKEPNQQTNETEAPDTIQEIVEKIAEDIAEKVGEDIVEDVAVVVKEVAEETLESVGEVAQVADLVENVTGRVSSTIDVIQDVLEAADKAAEEAGVPDTLIDVAEAVVEGVEIVVDTVNVIAGKVEELAESVVKEIEDLKAEAVELVEDEGKREELVEKIVDYLSESNLPKTADADQVQKPEEVSQEKELDLKESQPEDVVTVPDLIVEVTEPVPCEIEPVSEGTAPVVEITEPVTEVIEPAVEITEPVTEVTEPKVELTEPVIEVTEPVVEITEPVTEVTEPVVEVVSPITEKKEEYTESVEQDVKQVSESVEPEKDVSEVSAKFASEEEAESSGSEEIKPSIEDKGPVAVEKPSLLDNLLNLFRKDKEEKMIKEAVALPDKEEAGKPEPESLVAGEVLPVVEKLAEDIVKKAAEPVVEEVAEVIEEVSKEVEKEAEVIAETAEAMEKTGEEAAKCAEVIEGVAEAADKAAKDVPGVPEIVEEIAEKIDEVAKESEAVIDTVVVVAEKVEELSKEIVQEAKAIESAAAELVESKEKREELIENVIEFVGEKLSGDSPVEEAQSVVPETPVEADKVAEGIEPTPLVEEIVEAAVPVRKEGLFDKLVNLFKDKPATDDEGEKKLTEEEVSKSDEKVEVQEPREEVEEQKPTEVEVVTTPEAPVDAISEVPVEGTSVVLVDTTHEVPVDTAPEIPASIEAETLPEALVEVMAESPIQAVQEELPVQKVEESIADIASETQRKEGGLIGRLIDFFSKDERAPLSEQVSVKEEETSQTEVVVAPVDVAAVESAPEVPEETPREVPMDITPEVPVDIPTEVLVETTVETPPVQAEQEELHARKTDESVVESVPETPQKEGGLIGKLIDLFSDDEKTSHSEQVAGKDEETSQTELVTTPVDVAEIGSAPEVPAETPPEVPVDIIPEAPVDTPTEVLVETMVETPPVHAEPEELPVQKTDESVVESVLETPQKEGGLIGKLVDFFSDDEKTSHSEHGAGKDEETSQTELVTAPVDIVEVESVPEIPAETPPEVPAETPPEVPVDITPEITVDTSSEVSTGPETLAEVPAVETNVEALPIQAEPEVLPVQKLDESVVEAASETSRREGGLIGKLIDFFSDDEKTLQSGQVSGKDEETSLTVLVTEPLDVAEEKPADSEVKVAEPAVEPHVDEKDQTEEQVSKVEEPSETGIDPKESVPEQELPVSAEVSVKEVEEVKGLNQEEKVGLIDKLVNLFSSDKESDAAAETVTEQQVKVEEPVVSEVEVKEPAVEVTVTEEETSSPVIAQQEAAVTKEPEEMPSLEEPVSHVEPVEVKENVEGGLVGRLIGLFSKSEEKTEDAAVLKQTPEIEEAPEKGSDDKVADEMDFVIVEHSDVTEDKHVDPSDATAEKVIVDESTGITESKDVTNDDSGKSEGLIDKLLTFMSSTKEKETTDVSEVQEVPDVKQEVAVEPEPEVTESPSDGKAEEAEITPKTDATEMPSVPAEGSGGLFSSLGGIFTKEKSEVVESSTSDSSDTPDEKVIEDSTPSETVVAGPEAPTLEVTDKSLFDKIAEMISSNDKTTEDSKDETLGSTTQESQTEPSQEELPQQAPAVEDDQQKPLSGSSETEAKPSLFDRVTSLFSKESEGVPIDKEPTVKEESTEGSSSPDSKTATSEDDADVFVVLSKPTTPVETSPPEESQKEAEKATGWLQGSWFRSSASVSEEGKDVIIQVAPETPEKDYGQSNPDDADMYTTRN